MDALSIDWLRLTIPAESFEKYDGVPDALNAYGLYRPDMYERRGRGFLGWQNSVSPLPYITFAWGGQNGTACLDFSASGLKVLSEHLTDYFPEAHSITQWLSFMIKKQNARVSRIDLAFDDTSGVVDLADVWDALEGWNVVSHFGSYGHMEIKKRGPSKRDREAVFDPQGRTIYIGERSSESFIRFYDKAAQQSREGHWIRCELELKRTTADTFAREWLTTGCAPSLALAYLRSKVEFIDPHQTDSNSTRAKPAEWWAEFCRNVQKSGIKPPEGDIKTVHDAIQWFEQSAAPTLALLMLVFGPDTVNEIASMGYDRLKPKHFYMLEEAERQGWGVYASS